MGGMPRYQAPIVLQRESQCASIVMRAGQRRPGSWLGQRTHLSSPTWATGIFGKADQRPCPDRRDSCVGRSGEEIGMSHRSQSPALTPTRHETAMLAIREYTPVSSPIVMLATTSAT